MGINNNNVKLSGSSVALPVDLQFSAMKVARVILSSGTNVAASNGNNWAVTPDTTDWSGWKRQVWLVTNSHAFDVTINLQMKDIGDYTKPDGVTPMSYTVKAGARILITPVEFPILSETIGDPVLLRFSAATTGAGTCSVISYATPIGG